jgi:alginate O-acetyltransferase complex protein AlgI
MNFCTLGFLCFFLVMFAVYWALPGRKVRLGLLLTTGPYWLFTSGLGLAAVNWPAVDWSSWASLGAAGEAFTRGTAWLLNTLGYADESMRAAIFGVYWMAGILFVVTALACRVGHDRGRVWLLTAGSFFFYACFNHWLALIICVSTAMDYAVARGLDASTSPRLRRLLLALSLVANLGLLVYFKYANFFLTSLKDALDALGTPSSFALLSVVLPIGISFYTFEAINYTVDVYRKRTPAEKDLGNFMLFITFFPHLVAGPIVRARDFLPQIHRRKRWDWPRVQLGVQYILMGLFKKVAIANHLALFVDPVFANPGQYRSGPAWLALLAYALQIYCDFSGYTDMALGTAHLLGYKLAQNFNMPYLSANVSEFWRRWHISLSSWLRDYLFIPLGGSRGTNRQTCRNLMITMTLGGLWHGANWTFVVWGILHGLFLVIHRSFRAYCERWPRLDGLLRTMPGVVLRVVFTFSCVCLGWVFFRAATFATAADFLHRLVIPNPSGLGNPLPQQSFVYLVILVALCHALAQRDLWKRIAVRLPAPVMGVGYAAVLTLALLLAPEVDRAFIYFQF